MIAHALREQALCALEFAERWPHRRACLVKRLGDVDFVPADDPARMTTALAAYFAGDLRALGGIVVDPGGTPFQRAVWDALRRIPPGETMSYGTLARAIARPAAVRAVGAANGANRVGLVIPCHRVIGADGS